MANSDPVIANGWTGNCEMTKLVKELLIRITSLEQTVKCQEDTILILNKNVAELQNRLPTQEKYSSKDCLIFKNFPNNPFSKNLYNDVCKSIYHYFNYQITPDRIKACHPLKHCKNGITPIIVKFIYFDDKDFIFRRRKMLSDKLNGGKKLVIHERLPVKDAENMNRCNEIGLISTTRNCQVKVFRKILIGNYYSCAINSIKAVGELKHCAIRKRETSVARGFVRNDGTLRVDPSNHIDKTWKQSLNPFEKKTTNHNHSRKHKRDSPDDKVNCKKGQFDLSATPTSTNMALYSEDINENVDGAAREQASANCNLTYNFW